MDDPQTHHLIPVYFNQKGSDCKSSLRIISGLKPHQWIRRVEKVSCGLNPSEVTGGSILLGSALSIYPPPPVCGALTGIPVELHTWPSMSDLLLCFQGVVGSCEAPPGRGAAAARLPNLRAARNSSAAPWGELFQDVKSRRKRCCHQRRKAGAPGVRAIRPGRLSLKVRAARGGALRSGPFVQLLSPPCEL